MSLTFKLLIAAIIAFVVYAAWPPKVSDAQRVEGAKAALKQSCKAKGAASTQLPQHILEAYCACTTERAVVELGTLGIKRLSTSDTLTEKDNEIIKSVQAACLEKLRK